MRDITRKQNFRPLGCVAVKRKERKRQFPGFHLTVGFVVLLLSLSCPVFSQEEITIDGQPCGTHGDAKNRSDYTLNALKNRYRAPRSSDFDTAISLASLLQSGDPNQFSQAKAVVLRGYVYNVKLGGVETCNCKARDPQYRDTHIEITPDEEHTDVRYRLIAEVTPRLRALMTKKGIDWSTAALRKSIKGRWIEVAGWLTYDVEHETAAWANDPDDAVGQHNWRATVWEVHPITYLKVMITKNGSSLNTIVANQGGSPGVGAEESAKKGSAHQSAFFVIVGILAILVIGYFVGKKLLR